HENAMKMKSLAPVLFVEDIEPCLPFWTDRLGFAVHAELKDAGRLDFVLLLKDEVQIMYQTYRSLAEDLPQLTAHDRASSQFLYLSVDDLDAVESALHGATLVQPRRKTFYGAQEVAVREPSGNVIVFSQHD